MKKANLLCLLAVLAVTPSFAAEVIADTQTAPSSSDVSAEDQSTLMTVAGTATFERRSTMVPLYCTSPHDCAKPRIYWSLVVVSGSAKFELNQPLAMDQTQMPTALQVDGVLVTAGEHISILGQVQYFAAGYSSISAVRSVHVLPTVRLAEVWDPSFGGWNCQGEDGPHAIAAQVWRDETYHIRVGYADGQAQDMRTIAQIDSPQLEDGDFAFTYAGHAANIYVTLIIDRQDQAVFDKPARLRVQRADEWGNAVAPVFTDVAMVCAPVHLSL